MALDLEEQEQVAELKAWWTQHGNRVLAAVIAVAVAVVGWQGWRWYEHGQAAQASVLYDTLSKATQAGDAKALRDAAGTLVESYPRTLYASMGALLAAKFYFERNDLKNAKAQLQWVIEHSPAEDFRDLVRLLWSANVGRADRFTFFPALVGDSVYAAARDGTLARFDMANGEERWRTSVETRLSSGVGADLRTAAVATEAGEVIAVDTAKGEVRWRARGSSEVLAPPRGGNGRGVG